MRKSIYRSEGGERVFPLQKWLTVFDQPAMSTKAPLLQRDAETYADLHPFSTQEIVKGNSPPHAGSTRKEGIRITNDSV